MLQYFIPIARGTERFINSHQGSTTIMVNLLHNHDTTTTETTMFQNTIGGITFIMTSIDSGKSICSEQYEARFNGKENCSPPMSFSEMMCCENVASLRSHSLMIGQT